MESLSFSSIGYSLLAGILPALIWLYFLLHEDKRNPEPKLVVFIAFLAGMLAVPIVIPIEAFSAAHLNPGFPTTVAWAVAEETVKYALVAIFVLWRRAVDESIDVLIYMVTTALGFAALENTLFLMNYFGSGQTSNAFLTGDLRFIGSTLLHVVASSAIGFALAFTFRRSKVIRTIAAAGGLILAVSLHTLFNFLIISEDASQHILAFFVVWTGAVIFFALFEIVKYFQYRSLPLTT